MIKGIINGIFKLIISLVSTLLSPIDGLISKFLPSLDTALDYINDFFDLIGNSIAFVVSYIGLDSFVLSTAVAIITFILTVPLMVSVVKLAISWYNKLKL